MRLFKDYSSFCNIKQEIWYFKQYIGVLICFKYFAVQDLLLKAVISPVRCSNLNLPGDPFIHSSIHPSNPIHPNYSTIGFIHDGLLTVLFYDSLYKSQALSLRVSIVLCWILDMSSAPDANELFGWRAGLNCNIHCPCLLFVFFVIPAFPAKTRTHIILYIWIRIALCFVPDSLTSWLIYDFPNCLIVWYSLWSPCTLPKHLQL